MLTRALILLALTSSAHASTTERWFVLLLNNERAGYAHESTTTADGLITNATELRINLSRLGQPVELSVGSRFVETEAGEPVLMESLQKLGHAPVTERYEFIENAVRHTTLVNDRVAAENTLPRPEGDWLTPAQAERLIERAFDAGEKRIAFKTLDPSSGLAVVTQSSDIVGPTTVEAYGKTVPAIEWVTEQSSLPGVTTREFVDHAGNSVRSEIDLGGIRLVLLASEKELALSPASAPELMAQTLITPSRPIDNPRDTTTAVYILSRNDGAPMPEIPDDIETDQRAHALEDGRVRVEIGIRTTIDAEEEIAPIVPSAMADFHDPCIKELAERAVEGIDPEVAWKRAEALRRAVHAYINEKSLGVGFATASETCATREGDCTEHAVLLAAALRAVGIPSRVVSGLVYVPSPNDPQAEGVFGFHMWTQYQSGLYWYDLDATMGPYRAFDATHIALSTSTLSPDEAVNTMATLVPLLGTLQIEVVEIE